MKNGVYVCDNCDETKKVPKGYAPVYCPVCGKIMRWVEDYRY